jgi:hypothetical protein
MNTFPARLGGAIVLVFVAATSVFAQGGPPVLNYLPGGTDVVGRAPDLFINLRDDLFAVVDPLDNRVVVLDRNGRVSGSSAPLPFVPTSVRETPTDVEFIDGATGRRALLPRSAEPRQLGTLAVQEALPQPAGARSVTQRGNSFVVPVGERDEVVVRALAGGRLTNADLLGTDRDGRIYVETAEILNGQPQIAVRSFVQRFSAQRRLVDAASIPIADMDSVPNRTVALAPSGDVSAIVPTADRLFLQTLTFRPVTRNGTLGPQPAGPPQRTPIDAVVQESSLGPLPEEPATAAPLPATTRTAILDRANAFLAVNWTMKATNFSRAGIESRCAKQEGKFWLRAHRFTSASVGQTFGPMPYYWGGGDTPDAFRTKLAAGSLAGSICTCREPQFNQCVVNFAAGVDCSGFVSRSWGIPKHGTTALGQVSKPVGDVSKLKPGDALNKAGSHVRLFVGFKPGPQLLLNVIESATNLRCEGVCQSTYTPQQLAGYRPIRFSGTTD